MRASFERRCPVWTPVETVAKATANTELVLAPGTLMHVELLDANGPAAQASVTFSAGHEVAVDVATVIEGKGRAGPIAPGTYTVTLRRDWRDKNALTVESSITLNGEAERVLQLRFP